MVIFKVAIPRRTFLRGVGATLALPVLDAMTPAFAAPSTRPTRMAFMQTPNGIFNLNGEWTPKTVGANFELTRTLEPLAAFKDRMLVISGLDNQQAAGQTGEIGGDHPRACTAWLTGTHAKMTSGADLHAGISANQIAAKEFGKSTQLASLEIGLEVKRLRLKVGGQDRSKIDQYLDAIRDVERRMQLAEKQGHLEVTMGTPTGAPEIFSDYFKLMADLMVLAWQTDMTRVITFQMGHEMSGRSYPELGFGDAHHPCTHHQGDKEKQEKTTKINILHTKMLAYYLGRLRDTADGDGSLLDHSMILYGAGLSDANLHLYTDLSLLLVAGGVGGIKGGQHVRYAQRTPMANLLLTMLDKADIPHVEKLGDSTGRLDLPTT